MDTHIKVELDFIPIAERLPEKSKSVLMLYRGRIREGYWVASNQWHIIDDKFIYNATHWADIPEINTA